jgi:predicted permease
MLELGGLEQTKERVRTGRHGGWLDEVGRDVRYACRMFGRTPGLILVLVMTLALGIGANTAIFTIVNSLILRPLPVRDPARLVELLSGPEGNAWTYPLWQEIQARSDLFGGVAAWGAPSLTSFKLIEGGELKPVAVYSVSGDFFRVFGVQPALGRPLTPADEVRGPSEGFAAVISDAFWRAHLGSSENVIGTVLRLDRSPVTIVGITPPEFFGPQVGQAFDVIVPMSLLPRGLLDQRGFFWMSVMARLKPGQTPEEAGRALRAAQPTMRAATLPRGLRADQLREYLSESIGAKLSSTGPSVLRTQYREPLLVIMAAVGLVLLITCTNVANLLLARADARRHEFSVRLALGATRGRLVRQLLIESLLLAATGAAVGGLLATWGSRVLVSQLSTSTRQVSLALPLDWRVLGFTAAVAVTTALLFGLLPAVRATRVEPNTALAERGRGIVAGRSRRWAAHVLVVSQVALSLVLAVGAGLLVRTFAVLTTAELGFDPRSVLIASVGVRPGATVSDAQRDYALEAVRSTPGVAAAAFSGFTTPMSGIQHDDLLENPVGLSLPASERRAFFRDAGLGWFDVMGMRLVLGRGFTEADRAHPEAVAVINETLARRFFPDRNPIGQTLREAGPPGASTGPRTVVGVVADSVYNSAREGVLPALYRFIPLSPTIVVRAANGHGAAVARDVSAAISRSNPAFLATTKPMAELARDTVARERLVAMLSGLFGGLALLLAGIGVYGVMAYAVGRRRPEIAVRRALGATPLSVARLVVRGAVLLVAYGVAAGALMSVSLTGLLKPLLYGLGPRDPLVFALATVALTAIALLASWIPARRASRVDPAMALREG